MEKQPNVWSLLHKLGGYYLIPHELLHVAAYRIIGKPCKYNWGDYAVQPLASRTKYERLFVLLLPFTACWLFGLVFHFLWLVAALLFIKMPFDVYFQIYGLTWHFILPVIGTLFIIYSSTAHSDLIIAYNVLVGKDKSHEQSYDPHPQFNHQ